MFEVVIFGVVALAIALVGWLAWPVSDVLDLAPAPSRLRVPGLLMLVGGAIIFGWSILSGNSIDADGVMQDQNMRAVQFVSGCFLWLSGIILVSAAAITDAVNRR